MVDKRHQRMHTLIVAEAKATHIDPPLPKPGSPGAGFKSDKQEEISMTSHHPQPNTEYLTWQPGNYYSVRSVDVRSEVEYARSFELVKTLNFMDFQG